MKTFLPLICSLFLIGCSESQTPPSQNDVATVNEPNTSLTVQEAPVVETLAPVETPSAPEKPEKKEVLPVTPAKKEAIATTIDGGTLFGQKCASCHGAKGEKPALGKSAVIAEFSEQQIKDALKGYQAGTYGKEMKGLMQGQAKALNDAQIDALAKAISAR